MSSEAAVINETRKELRKPKLDDIIDKTVINVFAVI